MSLPTSRILSGFQSHLTLSPEGGLRSAIMRRLRLAGCRSCWQFFFFFFNILTLSGRPPCMIVHPSNGNERWYTHVNDIKKVCKSDLTLEGRCTKNQLRTSVDGGKHNLLLKQSCFQEAVQVSLAVKIISKWKWFLYISQLVHHVRLLASWYWQACI